MDVYDFETNPPDGDANILGARTNPIRWTADHDSRHSRNTDRRIDWLPADRSLTGTMVESDSAE